MKPSVLILSFSLFLLAANAVAQPKARRQQARQTQQGQQQSQGISQRARLLYPTSLDMPEDVVWRRDLYREINLDDDANSGLYYPVAPVDKQMNLFTYLFKLALGGYIPVYEYRLDGNESFSDSARVKMRTLLDNYHIYYEEKNGKLRVENSDIPSAEVRMYYLKESAYYDQANSQFRRKVIALCPVMLRTDEFSVDAAKYPLFWVRYTDVEPYLNRQTVTASNLNNAATMGLDDFFTMNHYQGKIYKAGNRLTQAPTPQFGELPANADSAARRGQQQIEAELQAFERSMFGHTPQRDSVETAKASQEQPQATKAEKKKTVARRRGGNTTKSRTASKPSAASSKSSSPRVSVRRQRH